jgi:Domain of Unknown Function (DUF1206)
MAVAEREVVAAGQSRPFRWLVRAGFVARGVTYGVVGGIAFALAVGAGSAPAAPNQQGALALIAHAPLGAVALVVIAVGLLAYALWKLGQGILGERLEGPGGGKPWDRVSNLAGGIVYVGFFAIAVRVLAGAGSGGSGEPRHAAAGVLGWPGGQVLVGAVGVILLAISLYQIYEAWRGKFVRDSKTEQMGSGERTWFVVVGKIGLISRALVFGLIGYFVLRTAIAYKPRDAVGLDGALARIHAEPLGPLLLGLAAAGLITFALYSLLEARYRRL